ncbi:WYL domain-containing protein [Paenibacillus spongiae]|uniref:WYL domain-containing protein n=2 Tax=Paenibacillus spongiae TaxID=2909671 RepID=A0ABY5SNK6_9BACL|nr:WYL domain-containing protein [Paenibacillus spongiae]
MHYSAGYEGSVTERTFNPYGIVNWKDKWYAVGYCHLRDDIRSFRVDRMRDIRWTDIAFQRPDAFSAGEFLIDSLLPDSGSQSNDQLVSVRIQGTPQALDDLCGHWLFSRTLVERTAEIAHFKLDEQSLYMHTPYYLLSFGGKIRITEPPELNDCLSDIAESLHLYYRSTGKH